MTVDPGKAPREETPAPYECAAGEHYVRPRSDRCECRKVELSGLLSHGLLIVRVDE